MSQAGDRFQFKIDGTSESVSALLTEPASPTACYVLAHGAGAGMEHPFLAHVAVALGNAGVATLRFQFPYMEAGRRRPDPAPLLEATVRSAVATARSELIDVPLFAGGKSMGGRMTSQAAAASGLAGAGGIIFLGFPLHAPGRPGTARGDHLREVGLPMLFLQGTRDSLADLTLIRETVQNVGKLATLHVVDGGDHSFKVRKRDARSADQVMHELVDAITSWIHQRSPR